MKSEVVCTKASPRTKDEDRVLGSASSAHSLRRKSGIQSRSIPRTVDSSRMGVGVVTFTYAAARWVQFGMPGRLHQATGSENCADFLRAELNKKRTRILEMRSILLLLFPGFVASWWGGGPVATAKRLGIDWPRFSTSKSRLDR